MDKKADIGWSQIITGLLVFTVVVIVMMVFVPWLWRLVSPFLGMSTPGQQVTLVQNAVDVKQELQYLFTYCGVADQYKELCKCSISLAGLPPKKILLHRSSSTTMDYYEFESGDQPAIDNEGWVDAVRKSSSISPTQLGGNLCTYNPNPSTVYDKDFLLETKGIVIYQKDDGSAVWGTDISVPYTIYFTFPSSIGVAQRKADNTHCLWLPIPQQGFFGTSNKDLVNPLPECAETPKDIDTSKEKFGQLAKEYADCAKSTEAMTVCKQGTLEIPITFTVQVNARENKAYLRIAGKGVVLTEQDIPGLKASFCSIVEQGGQLTVQQPPVYEMTFGPYFIVNLQQEQTCLYAGDIMKLNQLGVKTGITVSKAEFTTSFDNMPMGIYLNEPGTPERVREEQYTPLVFAEAQKQDVNYFLAKAITQQESNWFPDAQRQDGKQISHGLMQVTDETAHDLGCEPAFSTDPAANIACGVKNLKHLIDAVQAEKLPVKHIIAAYNGGLGSIHQSTSCTGKTEWECEKNEGYKVTRIYVPSVLNNINKLQQEAQVRQQSAGVA